MSTYRRSEVLGRTQRWDPDTGLWYDCAYDDPETRVRDPEKEGMVVIPVEDFDSHGPVVIPVDTFIAALRRQIAEGAP